MASEHTTTAKPVRWTDAEWKAVTAAAEKVGLRPTTFVKLFVLSGIDAEGLTDKLVRARRWFRNAKASK